ncbi:hypothetical protein MUO32_26345 [Shinella sp. CPCC 101442]|uniref:hypothetical protein n=1 Tax=Shinella sp. CPCC 101442 TaxID=2932265 RepID=UPI0021525AA6|nr:hypothetical protein [Shinella sp. CPCC 101442]MCR6502552.1 hypothetical protein [Shinella sp. CPCC 101442]
MDEPLRNCEIRLIIKPADAPADSSRLIPARVLHRTFTSVLNALKSADAELHGRKHRSEFFISNLAMSSNILEMREHARTNGSAVELLRNVAGSVYRSEFGRATEYRKLAQSIVSLGKAIDPAYPAVAVFETDVIPFDEFFARQAERLGKAMSPDSLKSRFHVGGVLGSFDGTLGNIDYRGTTWVGHLVLPGGGAQIECVFDRSKGEDAFNPYGNKRVTVRGRAIYTGDSQLPERMEVFSVEEVPLAREASDIRGSLEGKRFLGAINIGNTNIQ